MNILIIGNGKVGFSLAERLSHKNHDITIIDDKPEKLAKAQDNLDVLCIQGSAISRNTLLEANVAKQDIVIVVTHSDETNIISSAMVHRLSMAKIIARVRNPEYADAEDFIQEVIGIDMVINPELSTAREISRLLRFPHAHSMESFADGKIELIEFAIDSNSPILNKPLQEVMPKLKERILITLVKRNDEVFTPDGDTIIQANDHVFALGKPKHMVQFAKTIGCIKRKVKKAIIAGGGRIGYYLAKQVQKLDIEARIIEVDLERCTDLLNKMPNSIIIHGDGTDQDLLLQEQIRAMDAFVSITNRDEENILTGLFAKECGVPTVITKVKRGFYTRMTQDLITIDPRKIVTSKIRNYIRGLRNSKGSFVDTIYRVADNQAEIMEFTVSESAKVTNTVLKDLHLKHGILVAAILHDNKVIIPDGDDIITVGDRVIIVSTVNETFIDINDILDK